MTAQISPPTALAVEEPVAAPARQARMPRVSAWRVVWPPLVVAAALVAVWYLVSVVLLSPSRQFLLPSFDQVVTDGFLNATVRQEILAALGNTALVAFIGLVVAIVVGLSWAVAMSQAKWVERSFFPYAVVLQTIPILAIVPLIGFWFGFDVPGRVIVCFIIALFPIVSNALFGLQSADRGQRDLFRLRRASRWTMLWKLQFPAALPAILAGIRISAGLSVTGALVGDYFFRRGTPGLGALLNVYQSRLQSAELFAAIAVSCGLGIVIFWLFGLIGKLAVGRWYDW
jgi:NitT/TauT family transport system permease protein